MHFVYFLGINFLAVKGVLILLDDLDDTFFFFFFF